MYVYAHMAAAVTRKHLKMQKMPVRVRFVLELNLKKTTVQKKIVYFINLCSSRSHNKGWLKI